MRALIVGKTHMNNAICVGGLLLDTSRSIRLLTSGGHNQSKDTDYDVGQVWDIDFENRSEVKPPHVEDVIVNHGRLLGRQANLTSYLRQHATTWRGGPDKLFDGLVRATNSGSGYISHRTGVPDKSTGYWIPDRALQLNAFTDGDSQKLRYAYPAATGIRFISYKGVAPSISTIPAGTLVRVSLARWWTQPGADEERCFLQLSGWFL